MSKQRRVNHCTSKVRHACRLDAATALANSLGDRLERMAPYACKFCGGWHNGHIPVDTGFVDDPRCGCGHRAVSHESFPGVGCVECDCLNHREWIYRSAIEAYRLKYESHSRRLTWIYKNLPRAIVETLNTIFRRKRGPRENTRKTRAQLAPDTISLRKSTRRRDSRPRP